MIGPSSVLFRRVFASLIAALYAFGDLSSGLPGSPAHPYTRRSEAPAGRCIRAPRRLRRCSNDPPRYRCAQAAPSQRAASMGFTGELVNSDTIQTPYGGARRYLPHPL